MALAGEMQRKTGTEKPAARQFKQMDMPELEYTPGMAKEMAPLYEKVKHVIPSVEWPFFAPYIHAINTLKKERGAVVLEPTFAARLARRFVYIQWASLNREKHTVTVSASVPVLGSVELVLQRV